METGVIHPKDLQLEAACSFMDRGIENNTNFRQITHEGQTTSTQAIYEALAQVATIFGITQEQLDREADGRLAGTTITASIAWSMMHARSLLSHLGKKDPNLVLDIMPTLRKGDIPTEEQFFQTAYALSKDNYISSSDPQDYITYTATVRMIEQYLNTPSEELASLNLSEKAIAQIKELCKTIQEQTTLLRTFEIREKGIAPELASMIMEALHTIAERNAHK